MQEMKGNCVTLLACFVLLVVLAGMAVAQVDEAIFKAVDATNACPRILFSSGVTGCAGKMKCTFFCVSEKEKL